MPDDLADAQARLNAARSRARRKAAGPALDVSDEQLDALAEVGPSVVPEIEAYCRDLAGQKAVEMMQARAE